MTDGEDGDDQPTTLAAGQDDTAVVPPPTEAAPELAWSAATDGFFADSDQNGPTWRDRLRWAAVAAAVLLPVTAIVLLLVLLYDAHSSRTSNQVAPSNTPTVTTVTAQPPPPSSVVIPPAPPPVAASPTSTKPALPVAVEGSTCRLDSTPTVDPDGVAVYCAIFPEMPLTAMWSRTPGPLAWPKIGGVKVPDQAGSYPWVVVCEQQTGRTYNYCDNAIAQATYQGDGPMPVD